MDREAWRAAILGVAKSRTRLSDWTELNRTVCSPLSALMNSCHIYLNCVTVAQYFVLQYSKTETFVNHLFCHKYIFHHLADLLWMIMDNMLAFLAVFPLLGAFIHPFSHLATQPSIHPSIQSAIQPATCLRNMLCSFTKIQALSYKIWYKMNENYRCFINVCGLIIAKTKFFWIHCNLVSTIFLFLFIHLWIHLTNV